MKNVIRHIDDTIEQIAMPRYLYHYTSMNSFSKIVESKQLLLFNSYHMNDYMENNLILTRIDELLMKNNFPYAEEFKHALIKTLQQKIRLVTPYVFCFTQLDNSLSQWRAYGDEGYGVCLEFDTQQIGLKYPLSFTHVKTEMCISLHDIIYDTEEQIEVLKNIFALAKSQSEIMGDRSKETFAELAYSLISRFSPIYKAKEFSEEAEWRIIYTSILMGSDKCVLFTHDGRKDIGFMVNRDSIKSYFPWKPIDSDLTKMISKVTIGPKNQTSDYEIRNYLDTNDFIHTNYDKSNITYR